MRARLEVSKHGIEHVVVVVNDRKQPPLGERGARMRDAASYQVADRKFLAARDLHVRMLVVQHGDRGAGLEWSRSNALPLDQSRHRELEVMRDVTLAEPEKAQAWFRQRQHGPPRLERLLERRR